MARRKNKVESRLAVAVLGEGITEREYFKSLKKHKKLSFKFKPEIPKHSDINNIVNKAKDLSLAYDIVFCIIDLDRILANKKEKNLYYRLKAQNKQIKFIEHNPCFEIWLLLHFEYSSREYLSCNQLINHLKKYISDYQKSENYLEKKDLYFYLQDKLTIAYTHALRLRKESYQSKCDMHKLIEVFKKINKNNL